VNGTVVDALLPATVAAASNRIGNIIALRYHAASQSSTFWAPETVFERATPA